MAAWLMLGLGPSWGQELTVQNATWMEDGAAVNLEIVVSGKGHHGFEYQPQFVLRETRKAQSYEVKPVQTRRWMSTNDSNSPRTVTVPLPSAMAGRADLQNVEIVVSTKARPHRVFPWATTAAVVGFFHARGRGQEAYNLYLNSASFPELDGHFDRAQRSHRLSLASLGAFLIAGGWWWHQHDKLGWRVRVESQTVLLAQGGRDFLTFPSEEPNDQPCRVMFSGPVTGLASTLGTSVAVVAPPQYEGLTDDLRNALISLPKLDVVGRGTPLQKVLEEQKLWMSGAFNERWVDNVGELEPADYLMTLDGSSSNVSAARLKAELINTQKGSITWSATGLGCTPKRFVDEVKMRIDVEEHKFEASEAD